jgi:hypothetical protein
MKTRVLTLVPCTAGRRKSCDLLREALRRLAEWRADLRVVEADSQELSAHDYLLAIDSSRECRASEALKSRRIKPAAALYLPDLLASRKLLDPSRPLDSQWAELAEGLTRALEEEIQGLLSRRQEETAYFEEIWVVVQRHLKEARVVEEAGSPSEEAPYPPEEKKERLGLAANRFRNLFMRCDEITPLPAFATLHDVFQDACICMTYGIQHWERGEWKKAREYFEQASHQAGPMLRHKGFAGLREAEG